MTKPLLTVERLLQSGFDEVGCWEFNTARDLAHKIDLPKRAGVYAFAIDGVVQYVGLASKSLRQRLGFYRKPAASQRTNVRLNEIIRGYLANGTAVQILIAHPPEHEWNGLRIKGSEGLEAGIIAEFDLPWNMRGSQNSASGPGPLANTEAGLPGAGPRLSGRGSAVVKLVSKRPGMTELQIARALYGPAALQPKVNSLCRKLVAEGRIVRRGTGRANPYAYFPVEGKLDSGSSLG